MKFFFYKKINSGIKRFFIVTWSNMWFYIFLLTQKDFNGSFRHVVMSIEFFSIFLGQFLDYVATVSIEEIDEWLQYVQVESGRDEFSVSPPFWSCADEQSIAQPGLEETVFSRFVDVHVTAEDEFDIVRICEEDNQFWSNPHLYDVLVYKRVFVHRLENFWK